MLDNAKMPSLKDKLRGVTPAPRRKGRPSGSKKSKKSK
jgi:hypothetical protein